MIEDHTQIPILRRPEKPREVFKGVMLGSGEWRLPAITKAVIILNVVIHIAIFLTTFNIGNVSISGQQVLLQGEYYRIVTSAFTHVSVLHIAMNMSSMLQLGSSLEMQFGSIPFLFLTMWAVLIIGLFYVGISFLLWKITNHFSFMQTSGVGYSGVLFMYAILEAFHTRVENQSFFGMCTVPARMYPFILMLVIQFVMPGISFLGHLSGVLVGLLTVYGISEKIFLPSLEFCQKLETYSCLSCLVNRTDYVRCDGLSNSFTARNEGNSVCSSLCGAISMVWGYAVNIISTLLYIIGCPVERISLQFTACMSSCTGAVKQFFSPLFSSSNTSNSGTELAQSSSGHVLGGGTGSVPRYARVNQSESEV